MAIYIVNGTRYPNKSTYESAICQALMSQCLKICRNYYNGEAFSNQHKRYMMEILKTHPDYVDIASVDVNEMFKFTDDTVLLLRVDGSKIVCQWTLAVDNHIGDN